MSRKIPGEVRARTCGTKSPSRSEALRFIDSSKSPSVDGDLDESIKRSASDRLGDLVPQVRARTSPGIFRDMALQGLCLELSFKDDLNSLKGGPALTQCGPAGIRTRILRICTPTLWFESVRVDRVALCFSVWFSRQSFRSLLKISERSKQERAFENKDV